MTHRSSYISYQIHFSSRACNSTWSTMYKVKPWMDLLVSPCSVFQTLARGPLVFVIVIVTPGSVCRPLPRMQANIWGWLFAPVYFVYVEDSVQKWGEEGGAFSWLWSPRQFFSWRRQDDDTNSDLYCYVKISTRHQFLKNLGNSHWLFIGFSCWYQPFCFGFSCWQFYINHLWFSSKPWE